MTSKLWPHVIKDTGYTVAIRKVSPNTLVDFNNWFNAAYPEPEPPTQEINFGDEAHPDMRPERNESHPDYKAALVERRKKLNAESQNMLIDEGVVYELTDADKTAVADYKARYKARTGAALAGNDKSIFIRYIALGTPEDINELVQAITRRTQPTEGAIGEQLKSL